MPIRLQQSAGGQNGPDITPSSFYGPLIATSNELPTTARTYAQLVNPDLAFTAVPNFQRDYSIEVDQRGDMLIPRFNLAAGMMGDYINVDWPNTALGFLITAEVDGQEVDTIPLFRDRFTESPGESLDFRQTNYDSDTVQSARVYVHYTERVDGSELQIQNKVDFYSLDTTTNTNNLSLIHI